MLNNIVPQSLLSKMFLQALAVFAIICCSNLASGQIDYSKCSAYATKTRECLEQNNIFGTDQAAAAKALNIFSQNSSVCSIITQYKDLISCILDVSLNCLSDDYKTLLPSAEKYSSALTYFCEQTGSFNSTCLLGAFSEFTTCLRNNGPTALKAGAGFDEVKTYYCDTGNTEIDCYKEITKLSSCEDTRKILIKTSEMLKPQACGTMMVVSHIMLLVLSVIFSKYVCY